MSYRIRIMGGSGSGKSTLADRLGQLLGIETVIHIDDIFWQPGWQEISKEELDRRVKQEVAQHRSWVIDGNYSGMGYDLMSQTTDVILIYLPLYKNLWQLLVREIVRISPVKFAQISPLPLQVRDEPNTEPLWKVLHELGSHAIRYYKYRARELYQQFGRQFPQLKRHIYRSNLHELLAVLAESNRVK